MSSKKVGGVLLLGLLMMSLSACGKSSLFRDLSGGGKGGDTAVDKMQEALKTNRPSEALSYANQVIADPAASTENKKESYIVKGAAILDINGSSSSAIADAIQAATNSTNSTKNIVEALPQISTASATEAATALNQAATLGTLTPSQELQRSVANAAVVGAKVKEVFEVTTTGVTIKQGNDIKNSLAQLFTPDTESKTIKNYAQSASQAYTNSNQSGDVAENLQTISDITQKLEELNSVLQTTGSFTYTDTNGTHVLTPSSSNDDIQAAVNYQIKRVNK